MSKETDEKTCRTCRHGFEGTCSNCAGDNLGFCTEISDKGTCSNWQEDHIAPLLADIKDISLVLTKPEEWRRKHAQSK
jgi:hypothetical protein